jgi:hypothetical protein
MADLGCTGSSATHSPAMSKGLPALALYVVLGLVLVACTARVTSLPPVMSPTPTVYPETLGPQAAPLCAAAFSASAPVSMDWPMAPMLMVMSSEESQPKWEAFRLPLPFAAQSASEVKTLVCIRINTKEVGNPAPMIEVMLVRWPDGAVVGTRDFHYYYEAGGVVSSKTPGVVVRYISDQSFYKWLTAVEEHRHILLSDAEIRSVIFFSDGKTLVSADGNGAVKFWDLATEKELRTLMGSFRPIALSADGQLLALGNGFKTVKLWDVATGKEVRTLTGHPGEVSSIVFSPDGKLLASGSRDSTIKLWDVATGKEVRTLTGHSGEVSSVVFSPDGKLLASGSRDSTVRLWDVATGKEVRTLTGHPSEVSSIIFSPDGKLLASGSRDSTVKLWDVATGKEVRTLTGHSGEVSTVVFSPDGKLLASGSRDRTVRLWDVATGKEVRTLTGHSGEVSSIVFSPDGKLLASGSRDSTVNLWDVAAVK